MPPDDLDKIQYKDAMNMWHLYQKGMAGPSVNYINNYHTIGHLNKLTELTTSINSKNHKSKPLDKFEVMFPEAHSMLALKKPMNREGLALSQQAVLALMGSGMPKHIADSLQEK